MSEAFHPPATWKLPGAEARFLNALLAARETATKQWLMDTLYGDDPDGGPDPKIIDVYVCKLRPKLRALFGEDAIETVWGRGYRIDEATKAVIRAHSAPPPQEQAA